MASRAKQKGDRAERNVVSLLNRLFGVHAWRIPLGEQAAPDGSGTGDLLIDLVGTFKNLRAEVKSRKGGEGFKTLEKWLGSNDLMFLHRNLQLPMVVMPWETFQLLLTSRSKPTAVTGLGDPVKVSITMSDGRVTDFQVPSSPLTRRPSSSSPEIVSHVLPFSPRPTGPDTP
jgi:hypothetical protein